jgi:hypothetical protein
MKLPLPCAREVFHPSPEASPVLRDIDVSDFKVRPTYHAARYEDAASFTWIRVPGGILAELDQAGIFVSALFVDI